MATPEPQRRADRDPTDPLNHRVRRRILRHLHRCGEPLGPREVEAALGDGLSQIAYHLKTLTSYGTTREAGLAPDGDSLLYESAVSENADVLALLAATEAEDEGRKAA
jgi:DNA-binding transcriptional ArsR family regulator